MEKRIVGGKQKFWIEEKKPQVSQEQEESAPERNNPVENGVAVDEVPREEIRTEQMIGLMERITTLEKENGELKRKLQENETKMSLQETIMVEIVEKEATVERAIREIAQHTKGQATFNERSKRAIACLENQVKIHQDNIHEVVLILQVHEQYVVDMGSVT